MGRNRVFLVCLACVAAASTVVSSPASGKPSATNEVVVGFTEEATGPLAAFGKAQLPGVQDAVNQVNRSGGVMVDGKKEKVKLVVLDNKSDPQTAAANTRQLFLQDHAVAVLAAAAPGISIAASDVAEQLHKPVMNIASPIEAWLAGNPKGWKWAWDIFFDETALTQDEFKVADLVSTNKKVVLFTDTEQDGVTMGALWTKYAPTYGYTIVAHEVFPPGTTDFSSFINDAKSKGAEVLIAQMIPPDGQTLWKQMKSLGYVPKVAIANKAASAPDWEAALGPLAQGTIMDDNTWSAYWHRLGTSAFVKKYLKKLGRGYLDFTVRGYANSLVLLHAISKANSTDPTAINNALANSRQVPIDGKQKFNSKHYIATKITFYQVQGNDRVQIWAPGAQQKHSLPIEAPPPGLK